MLFNSAPFALFFPLVTIGFFVLPQRLRWEFLLLASLLFYMAWRPAYVLVLLTLIAIDYVAARAMAATQDQRARRRFLLLSLAANLGLLFVFKYYAFFASSLGGVLQALGSTWRPTVLEIALPIGISFHTFQALGYTIDVYRGRVRAEPSLQRYALFVSYFPQLVAGPIERASHLLPQLGAPVRFDGARAADGLRIMAWGLFKKAVIADRMTGPVSVVYAAPGNYDGPTLAAATLMFAVQIYGDFSGYSDMAIGAAKVLGVDLVENFRAPYGARNVREFWRRWHMSLSTWFRDYVYVPLGGNRVSPARWCFVIVVVFALSGLWHGANWTFLVWGLFHGGWMIASRFSASGRARVVRAARLDRVPRVHAALQTALTFVLVSVGWVFFRSSGLGDAGLVLGGLGRGWGRVLAAGGTDVLSANLGLTTIQLGITVGLAALLFVSESTSGDRRPVDVIARQAPALRWLGYYAMVALILTFGVFDDSPFIYFQF